MTRATLKNAVPYVDDAFPDLLFLVPKPVARGWRWGSGPDNAALSVQIRHGDDAFGGPPRGGSLILDLPTTSLLRLRRRATDSDTDEIVTARIRHMCMRGQSSRCADLDVVLVAV